MYGQDNPPFPSSILDVCSPPPPHPTQVGRAGGRLRAEHAVNTDEVLSHRFANDLWELWRQKKC